MADLFAYEFVRNALWTSLLVSLVCGVVGTLVVLNRIVFISGGIAHAAYGGVGLAYYLGVSPVLGAIALSLVSSLTMGLIHRRQRQHADTLIGVMWAIGMAIGIIFLNLSPGYKADLMSYLFGSILAVSAADLMKMMIVLALVLVFIGLYYRQILAISYDEVFSTVRNLPVDVLYLAMIALIGLAVVISMRVVGLIMVIALLSIPAAIASMYAREMWRIMLLSVVLSILFTVGGLLISLYLNLPSGAVIILVMGLGYLLALLIKSLGLKPAVQRT